MISNIRKPLAYSGFVHFGTVAATATWDIKDETCIILRFIGPLNAEQMDALAEYRTCNHPIKVRLPGGAEYHVEIVGYDKAERSFCLSIRG